MKIKKKYISNEQLQFFTLQLFYLKTKFYYFFFQPQTILSFQLYFLIQNLFLFLKKISTNSIIFKKPEYYFKLLNFFFLKNKESSYLFE